MQTVDPDRLEGVDLRLRVPRDQVPDALNRLGLITRPARRRRIHPIDETPPAAGGSGSLLAPLARRGLTITLRTGGSLPQVTVRLQPVRAAQLTSAARPESADDGETPHLREDWNGSEQALFATLTAAPPAAGALPVAPGPTAGVPLPASSLPALLTAGQRSFLTGWAGVAPPSRLSLLGPLDEQRWTLRAHGAQLLVRRWSSPGSPVTEPGPDRFDELELLRPVPAADAPFLRPVFAALARRLGLDPDTPAEPLPQRAARHLTADAAARAWRQR